MEIKIYIYMEIASSKDGMIRDPMVVRVAGFVDVSGSATLHVNAI